MQNYKLLKVWEKSHDLAIRIHKLSASFPREEAYSITSQVRRCAFSIPANIAEGCGKPTDKEKSRFFSIALGSANETEYFLLVCKDLGFIAEVTYRTFEDNINEIKAMLISLIRILKAKTEIKTEKNNKNV